MTRMAQYTRSSVSTFGRRKPIVRRARLKRSNDEDSAGDRRGMKRRARTSSSELVATTWRTPSESRRAIVQPSSEPAFSRARPASLSGFSLAANSLETRRPASSSSQYATVSGKAGPRRAGRDSTGMGVRSEVFECMSFALRGASCGDDAHLTLGVRGDHNEEEPAPPRCTNNDPAVLIRGVTRVGPRPRELIESGLAGLLETDPVLDEVLPGLLRVPGRLLHGSDDTHAPCTGTYVPAMVAAAEYPIRGRFHAANEVAA